MKQRPFLISGYIGIGVVIVGLVMLALAPSETGPLPRGFFTPIVALEFARSERLVLELFGPAGSPLRESVLLALRRGVWLDFLFMLLYGGFLFTFARRCAQLTGRRLYQMAAIVAVVAVIADAVENIQLLQIMNGVEQTNSVADLLLLQISTWLKWGSLAILFLLLIPFLRNSNPLGRFAAMVSAVPIVFGMLAYLGPGAITEFFALSISTTILLLIAFALTYESQPVLAARPKDDEEFGPF